jgi:hypothetical protein
MRKVRIQLFALLTLGFIASFLVSCSDESADPQTASSDEYFPLEQGFEWTYSQTLLNGDTDPLEMGQVNLQVDGDTVVEGKEYLRIVEPQSGFIKKVIRKEGSKYFGRNHEMYGSFSHEYVFLDAEIAEGKSWHYLKFDGATKTEYVVKSVTATRTVNGVTYQNVLELEVNYYDQVNPGEYKLNYSVIHAYAKGIGEIYSYYPYPASGLFGDLRTELISATR